ncbi:THAP domain-containing protein 5-like [Alosa sapidissima]|uniref:THAP domain-containing protein 5-like n=1 Tax=Alosa sapidissima TaxID=34773 RepID=UPI001C08C4BA|nr:THAP domain-containing protein 5-like [Alosa sapidissima]
MPKYCSAPNCKNDSGNTTTEKKSFYKFPLHDSTRLQSWLKNMDREDWTPSRHQYLCHEHFLPSCFTIRWGIRYLDNNAVPTIFDWSDNKGKRKGVDHFERRAKRTRSSGEKPSPLAPLSDPEPQAPVTCSGQDTPVSTVQLYTVSVATAQPGEAVLLDPGNIRGALGSLQMPGIQYTPEYVLEAAPALSGDFPVALRPTLRGPGTAAGGEPSEVVVVVETPSTPVEDVKADGIVVDVLAEGQRTAVAAAPDSVCSNQLTIDNVSTVEELADVAQEEEEGEEEVPGVQLIAYFETIPNVLPSGPTALVNVSPDTVLSSSLGSRPIVSTVPIVSKHMPPAPDSLVLTLERLEDDKEDVDRLSENGVELHGKRLEEHRYHKNSLSKEQLEAIVVELQKKVKVLQQRHRRHLDKLLGLETTVSQLRQTNLVNEERLQLLERAYLQTSAAVTEAGETVAIIYGDDNTTYLYAQQKAEEEEEEEVGQLL